MSNQNHRGRALLPALLVLLLPVLALAQDSENMTRVGTCGISGDYYDVKIYSDEVAYCTNRFGLVVMDISNPEQPLPVNIIPTTGKSQGLFLKDSLLFLCDGYNGLIIFDINDNPFQPQEINHVEGPTNARGLEIDADYAYLWQGRSSRNCYIYDVSDPLNPIELSVNDFGGGEHKRLHIFGELSYFLINNGQSSLWDIGDRSHPELIERSDQYPRSYELSTLLIAQDSIMINHTSVLSLINPTNPAQIASLEVTNIRNNYYRSPYLYSTVSFPIDHNHSGRGIACFDLSDFVNPTVISIGRVARRGRMEPNPLILDVLNNIILATDEEFGLSTYHEVDGNIEQLGYYDNRSLFMNVALYGDYLYTFDELSWENPGYKADRLRVYSITDPRNPRHIADYEPETNRFGNLPFLDGANIPKIVGNHLFTNWAGGLAIFDLDDPENPSLVSVLTDLYDFANTFKDYEVDGDLVFGVYWSERVYSIADLEHPQLLTGFRHPREGNLEDHATCCELDSQYFYVGDERLDIRIYDRSDPSNLQLVGRYQFQEASTNDILLYGDYLYVTISDNDGNGIVVLDVTDRTQPRRLGNVLRPPGSSLWQIREKDGLLYVTCSEHGVYVYSLEDPVHPQLAGYYDTPGLSINLEEQGGYLYVADFDEIGVYDVGRITGFREEFSLLEDNHNFGSLSLDTSVIWILGIVNNGLRYGDVIDAWIDAPDDNAFHCDLDSGGVRLFPDDTLWLPVSFAPRDDTLYQAELLITTSGDTLRVGLAGRGVANSIPGDEEVGQAETPILLSVSPNPFNSMLTISFTTSPINREATLRIYDISGREVYSAVTDGAVTGGKITPPTPPAIAGGDRNSLVWDATGMPGGVYFVRLQAGSEVATQKVVLLR